MVESYDLIIWGVVIITIAIVLFISYASVKAYGDSNKRPDVYNDMFTSKQPTNYKFKPAEQSVPDKLEPKEEVKETKKEVKEEGNFTTISLIAVKRKENKDNFTGYETDEQVANRIKRTNRKQFLNLNVDDRPFTQEQWNKLVGNEKEIIERNKHEQSMLYKFDAYGKINPKTEAILTRKFKDK